MIITTAEEIRIIEEKENEVGTDFLTLMEQAGSGCAELIRKKHPSGGGLVTVFSGSGKNGGDGFVIARKLKEAGYEVVLVRAFGPAKAEDAVTNEIRALEAGVPVYDWGVSGAKEALGQAVILVDCLFGIGFRGAANELQTEVFEALNRAPGKVVSIDVPSGVITDTGEVLGAAVKADETIAISTLKPLHAFYPGREYCGEISILDIGLLPESYKAASPRLRTLGDKEARALLPVRSRTAHKNNAGHILSLCGSYRMPGAACLCANGAVRAGAGLVTAAYPEPAYPAISSHLTECMSLPLSSDANGQLSEEALFEILKAMETRDVLVAGPGLGQSPELVSLLKGLLEQCSKPMVLDADALNNLAHTPEVLRAHNGPVVITPHPGEMARFTGLSVSEVQEQRPRIAKQVADEFGVTVLLKGADTLIASSEREAMYVNLTGNEGLAKGGSGDTLAGILAAFLAQGMPPADAATCAAYYHGKAAEYCGKTMAIRSILATDLIDALPYIL